jgi:hypothetical protein
MVRTRSQKLFSQTFVHAVYGSAPQSRSGERQPQDPTPSQHQTRKLRPSTLNPKPSNPQTLNPQPSTLNPQPSTLNPQPSTLNAKGTVRTTGSICCCVLSSPTSSTTSKTTSCTRLKLFALGVSGFGIWDCGFGYGAHGLFWKLGHAPDSKPEARTRCLRCICAPNPTANSSNPNSIMKPNPKVDARTPTLLMTDTTC